MFSRAYKLSFRLVLFVILALVLSSCAIQPPKGRKPSPDWSRGVYLGQFVRGSIGITVEEDGGRVHIVWPYQFGSELGIQYVQLDSTAEPVVTYKMEIASGGPFSPYLLPGDNGQAHLFWASRPAGAERTSLWHVLLDRDGRTSDPAQQLVEGEAMAGGYDVASDGSGGAFLVWGAGDGGVHGLEIAADGRVDSAPTLIASAGESPAVRVDVAGIRHLAWRQGTQIFYTAFPKGTSREVESSLITSVPAGTGVSLVGPNLGLSDGWVYLCWSLQNRSGLEAGTARTEFVSFPIGTPETSAPDTLWMYRSEDQPYRDYEGSFPFDQYVRPAPPSFSADFAYQPTPLQGQRVELAVALAVSQEFRQDVHAQIALALFEEGKFKGYQMASKTDSLSQEAALAADAAGHLHLVWREGGTRNRVYYATTAPTGRAALDRLDEQDLLHFLLQGSMEGISGLAMFPFALIWIIPGLALLGVLELTWSQEKQPREISRAMLAIAIILYQTAKLFFFPVILSYVPFSAWLDLPESWGRLLRPGVPLVILGLAFLVATWVRRRQESQSSLLFYFALAATDAFLTLIVYGVNFWDMA